MSGALNIETIYELDKVSSRNYREIQFQKI